MKDLESGQGLPADQGSQFVTGHIELFELWHNFEGRQSFELVVHADQLFQILMPGPPFINLIKLVIADVELF